MILVVTRYYCIVNIPVIIVFINSSLYSCDTYTQVKEMVILHLFIEHHYKALYQSSEKGMSLLFTCPQLTVEESSLLAAAARNVAAHYAIYFCQVESIPQFLELWPISMHFDGTLILLYFIEMLPHTVSSSLV